MQTPSPFLLQLKDICVRFGNLWALQNINLTLYPRDVLAIIGPNGGGKTTLLKTIAGILQPTSGQILSTSPPPKIGYVPQRLHFDLSFPITVAEFLALLLPNIPFWRKSYPKNFPSLPYFKNFKIDQLIHKKLGDLSGGQLQRVLITAALLGNPDLLLLDEPAANIDQSGSNELSKLLASHQAQNPCSIVLVSHDLHFVSHLAQRVICLNSTICAIGSPEEVLNEHHLSTTFGRKLPKIISTSPPQPIPVKHSNPPTP
ncbi:MAG: metal ABC transporter ATP-binding protein [Chthoniobacterales bacterium]|nr:metal ABC transporter ATP-binding protein [Chthoniobacterales bacterium]